MKITPLLNNSQHGILNVTKLSVTFVVLVLALSVFGIAAHTVHGASAPAFTFTNYEVARSWNQSFAGVTCPNSGSNCWNFNAEPNIATAPDGTIYIVSENTAFNHPSECKDPVGGTLASLLYICGGTGAWKSTDHGEHFTTLTSPNVNFEGGTPVTLWGGDTHVAVAPAKNLNGQYNVYVVSLEAAGSGLIGIGESTSQDGGATWSGPTSVPFPLVNPAAAPGVQDRPWVAAYGASTVCVESHTGATIPGVFCSTNAGLTFPQSAAAFDAAHSWLTAETSIPGVLRIDPNNGYMYLPFSGVANVVEAAQDSDCGSSPLPPCPIGFHAMYVAVSTDGGLTFSDYPVYVNPSTTVNYGEQFTNLSVDSSGNLYEVFSDGVSLFYSYSTTHGQTWSQPYQVNQAPSAWAVMPWSTAGDAGKLDIVWYGTNGCGAGVTDVDNCNAAATWQVFFAQNLNVFSNPSQFVQQAVTGTIHLGQVCLNGSGCQSYRGLFDDFGVTTDPISGLATIVYDNDMYTPADSHNRPNPDCSGQYTPPNDPREQNCVHTNIAHQTSGQTISTPPCRESDGEGDFHGTNGNGHFSFDRDGCRDGDHDSIDSSDRGDGKDFHSTEIDSVQYDDTAHTMTVVGLGTVNGLPVAFTFVATETGLGNPGAVALVFSDGYANAGPLTTGSIILH